MEVSVGIQERKDAPELADRIMIRVDIKADERVQLSEEHKERLVCVVTQTMIEFTKAVFSDTEE